MRRDKVQQLRLPLAESQTSHQKGPPALTVQRLSPYHFIQLIYPTYVQYT